MNEKYIAKVVKIINPTTVVINAGSQNGLRKGAKLLIVRLDEEVRDPESGEVLEVLELVIGEAEAIHVQDKITTIESTNYKPTRTKKRYSPFDFIPSTIEENITPNEKEPFKNVEQGDYILPAS